MARTKKQAQTLRGQYFTPAALCDLMLALLLSDRPPQPLTLLEPGCGQGIFLQRALHWHQQIQPEQPLILHGLDTDPVALAQAEHLLQRSHREAGVTQSVHHLHALDFLGPLPLWEQNPPDMIVGNPPYIRHEHWLQAQGAQHKQHTQTNLQDAYLDYVQEHPEQRVLFSAQTDTYVAFFLRAASVLPPGGRLGFVVSNSWMNARYGQAFRHFLRHHFQVRLMVESACERWFPTAAVNAVILILERRNLTRTDTPEPPMRCLRLHAPLQQGLPDPQAPAYWSQLHNSLNSNTLPHGFQEIHLAQDALLTPESAPQPTLAFSVQLRAPLALTEMLHHHPSLWCRLDQLGTVRYPLKTGINPFFYLSASDAKKRQIEPQYLFPVIRSARQVQRYTLTHTDCADRLFSCPLSVEELRAQGHSPGALAYIEWGQQQWAPPRQKRAQPVRWPEVSSVQGRRPWHFIPPSPPPDLLCSRFIDQRFFFPLCDGRFMADQTFYGLQLHRPEDAALVAALLNSTLSYAWVEFHGRTNLGEGVLQYARQDMAALPVIQPDLYTPTERQAILACWIALADTPILPWPQAVTCPLREALDLAILGPLLQATGMSAHTAPTYRATLVDHLSQRMTERHQAARTVLVDTR